MSAKGEPTNEPSQRVAYTLGEFAAMMGKERTWAYRQVQAGRLKVITGYGTMMVPATEIQRLLGEATTQEPQG